MASKAHASRDVFTPEDFFEAASNLPREIPADALYCSISRAQAVISLVMGQFDGSEEKRFNDGVICNALWGVSGELEQIKKMIQFGWETRREDSRHV